MLLLIWVFGAGVIFLVAVWLIYPIVLKLLALFTRSSMLNGNKKEKIFRVSILIAAHNEEARIIERVSNCLSCDYPEDMLEIVVVSDGSSDDTVRRVRE
ncbi:MAG: glycosyltransferase, partial [Methanobacteriota archaeon]